MSKTWKVGLTQNETPNISDKTFTVPASTEWQILWVWAEYTSSSAVGSRQLEIQIQDSGSDIIAQWQTGKTQGASLTNNYLFGIGVPDLLSLRDSNYLMTPLGGATFLAEGQKMRIWDNKAISTSGDSIIVQIEYGYHDV